MRTLDLLVSFSCAAALIGCQPSQDRAAADKAADTAAATPAMPVTPGPVSLADVAGKWDVRVMPETGDSTLLQFQITATADTAGWTFTFPGQKPLPARVVAVGGDSFVTEAGPYESPIRKGVRVRTRGVWRPQDEKLVGSTVARYETSGPDTVLRVRAEATRRPE